MILDGVAQLVGLYCVAGMAALVAFMFAAWAASRFFE